MADFDDTNGDDILFGTDEDHAIRGFAGNDFPSGAGRNDLIPACSEDVCIRIMPAAHATTDWVSLSGEKLLQQIVSAAAVDTSGYRCWSRCL